MIAMKTYTLLGLGATLMGCCCIYLASDNQRWLADAWPKTPARAAGAALLVLAWLGLAQDMQRLTASFLLVAALMLVFAVLPYLGALRRRRTERAA
jgi:hypothetical protein